MRLAWLTDIHLNFVTRPGIEALAHEIHTGRPDVILIGGDIGHADSVVAYLELLSGLLRLPIFFVLGNHDYYHGSVAAVRAEVAALVRRARDVTWLTVSGPVPLPVYRGCEDDRAVPARELRATGLSMTSNAMLGFVLPAVLFAAVYFPMVTQLSIALVSPYAKADVRKRLFAATMDGVPVITAWLLYWDSGSPVFPVIGAGYVLLRDSMRGQSVGKLLLGLVVISLETGRPCTLKASVWRNVVFLIPGANVVAVFLEPLTVVRDPQGQRLGDKLAQTQVIEGFGVRDLAASFQRWWRSFLSELSPIVRKPGREPVDVKR